MSATGKRVIRQSGNMGVLSSGASSVYNADDSCVACCSELKRLYLSIAGSYEFTGTVKWSSSYSSSVTLAWSGTKCWAEGSNHRTLSATSLPYIQNGAGPWFVYASAVRYPYSNADHYPGTEASYVANTASPYVTGIGWNDRVPIGSLTGKQMCVRVETLSISGDSISVRITMFIRASYNAGFGVYIPFIFAWHGQDFEGVIGEALTPTGTTVHEYTGSPYVTGTPTWDVDLATVVIAKSPADPVFYSSPAEQSTFEYTAKMACSKRLGVQATGPTGATIPDNIPVYYAPVHADWDYYGSRKTIQGSMDTSKVWCICTAPAPAEFGADYLFSGIINRLFAWPDLMIDAVSATKVYGEADPELPWVIYYGELLDGEVITGSLVRTAGENVGSSYYIDQGTLASSWGRKITFWWNYSYFSITKAPLTITADDKSKTDGDADPALTYTITSGALVGSDTITGALTRAAGESPGAYSISQGSMTAGSNYDITFVPGTLTINAA